MSGLVENLRVVTDTREQLKLGIQILQKRTSKVSHYRTGKDVNGTPYLILMWHEGDGSGRGMPLLAPMDSAEAIADQIFAWLKGQEYGQQPDHDGSNSKGFVLTTSAPCTSRKPNQYHQPDKVWSSYWACDYDRTFYDFCVVQPAWIEYHK